MSRAVGTGRNSPSSFHPNRLWTDASLSPIIVYSGVYSNSIIGSTRYVWSFFCTLPFLIRTSGVWRDWKRYLLRLSRRRLSALMTIVQSDRTYKIYFTSTPSKHTRCRIINGDATIRCVLALRIDSLQQIDIDASTIYQRPTDADRTSIPLVLLNQPNAVNIPSQAGDNYFDRFDYFTLSEPWSSRRSLTWHLLCIFEGRWSDTDPIHTVVWACSSINRSYQLASFAIDGNTTIDLKVSPLLMLTFNWVAIDPPQFFVGDVSLKFALLFGVDPSKIRRVSITATSSTG